MKVVVFAFFILGLFAGPLLALDNGLGLTPQMAWNSWNEYGCNIDQTLIHNTIDQMVALGLPDVGFTYVNLDDCWQSWRNASGIIQPDNQTFPDGIVPLVEYAHSKGLKFGLYSDAGNYTCQGRPGSLGFETNDANTYASWGVDYLKYDNCYNDHILPMVRYPVMQAALNATNRKIFYSMCEWGDDEPATWAGNVGNSWRTTTDIKNAWDSILHNIERNDMWWKFAAPGGWNDPDMLECPKSPKGGITESEFEAEFALWCIAKAPLIIGCDLSTLSNATLTTLKNTELIAVNQDSLGVQGHRVTEIIWSGPLSGGRSVVAALNRERTKLDSVKISFEQMGFSSSVTAVSMRDILLHEDLGVFSDPFVISDIPARSIKVFVATPVTGAAVNIPIV